VPLHVHTPVGSGVFLSNVCRSCELVVCGQPLTFDFTLLQMTRFDVILGMDWLYALRACIECFHARVSLCTPERVKFCFIGKRDDVQLPRQVKESMLLANMELFSDEKKQVELLTIVCMFPDVFPKDLPGLPPKRVVDFANDLVPGIAPISMAPYRMAPAEMKELNARL
jgi:hypothetical protein